MKRKFSPHGLLALSPAAIDAEFDRAAPRAELTPDLAIVTIRGPLFGYADADGHFDSYEGVRRRVSLAIECGAPLVVLLIDSPGGLAAGCLELSRDLRARAAAAGKELVAYVDGQACSAAYALACAASRIFVGESSSVGSVGIIDTLLDQTALNRESGLRIEVIASGERKTDGNPHTPMTDDAIEASRARVEQLAASFFELVGKARGMSSARVRALEAGVFLGSEGVRVGLADQVCTFDEMLAHVGGKASPKASRASVHAPQMGAQAIAGGPITMPAPRSPARVTTARTPPKPTVQAPREPTMSATEFNNRVAAVEHAQRQMYFDARPHLPAYLVSALQGEPMARIRRVVAAYEGTDGRLTPVDPELARIDRLMGIGLQAPASRAQRRGNTLYMGTAPSGTNEDEALARVDRLMSGGIVDAPAKATRANGTVYLGPAPR